MTTTEAVAAATHFYVVNLSHSRREHRYITFWRADDSGYAWPLPWAGRYERARIFADLDYYNSGANIAVPCGIVEQLAVQPEPGEIDGDVGPVVPSNVESWRMLLAHKVANTKYKPKPVYRRTPRKRSV